MADIEFRDITPDGLLRASSFKGPVERNRSKLMAFSPYDRTGANVG